MTTEQTPAQRMEYIERCLEKQYTVFSKDTKWLLERCRKLERIVETARWAATCYSCSNDCGCAGCNLLAALTEAGYG